MAVMPRRGPTRWPIRHGQPEQGDGAGVSDAELLDRIVADDRGALEELFRRYGGVCYGLAARIIGDEGLAQDVVQEVFLACWRGAGFDPNRGNVGTWLKAITHHKAVDMVRREERLRSRRAPESALRDLVDLTGATDESAWQLLRGAEVRKALQALPAEQREVLLLAYYGGYSQREISALSGVPLGTVKTRTLLGMRRLRKALGPTVSDQDEDRR
jgi:RNA polymerase sigma-70 factor (ECF subfamily)